MKYCSDDGKMFDTEQACLDYEKKLADEKAAEAKKEEERKADLTEIQKLMDELGEKADAYYEKWNKPASITVDDNIIGTSFGLMDLLRWFS